MGGRGPAGGGRGPAGGRRPPGDQGPDQAEPEYDHELSGDQKKLRRMKVMLIVGCVLFAISAGTLALVYGLSSRYDSKTNHDDLLGDGTRNQNTNLGTGPLNYLM